MKGNRPFSIVLSMALTISAQMTVNATNVDEPAACTIFGFCEYEGKKYWYEDSKRQGVYGDPKNIWDTTYDKIERGREIYDPESDGWYWLDAVNDGAAAYGKEVWMPYIYQREDECSNEVKWAAAQASDEGMAQFAYDAMINKTGKWVRYDEKGRMLKGWVTIEGTLAEFYPEQAGNTYYYDHMTGLMAKGTISINGQEYRFDETTGVLQKDSYDEETRIPSSIEDELYEPKPENMIVNEEEGLGYVNNMVIIVFDENASDAQILSTVNGLHGKIVGKMGIINQYQIEMPAHTFEELKELVEEIEQKDCVLFAHYDQLQKNTEDAFAPNDPWDNGWFSKDVNEEDWTDSDVDGSNWWLEAIEAPEAWDHRDEMSSVKIGVVDDGFEASHEDFDISFAGKAIIDTEQWDDENQISYISDHGTHVAGIIGAKIDNGKGISGVCPKAELIGFDWTPAPRHENNPNFNWNTGTMIYCGLISCVTEGKKIINFSVGQSGVNYEQRNTYSEDEINEEGQLTSQYMAALLAKKDANDQRLYDFVVVQSAGNCQIDAINNGLFASITEDNCVDYQERLGVSKRDILDRILVVAAVERTDQNDIGFRPSRFTNGGSQVSIAAPGGDGSNDSSRDIYSTYTNQNGKYGVKSGTSMAAPMVSGVCGMVWSLNEQLKGNEVVDIVKNTASIPIVGTSNQGQGYLRETSVNTKMVNARAAVEETLKRKHVGSLAGKVCKASDNSEGIGYAAIRVYKSLVIDPSVDHREIASVIADENGNYEVSLPEGSYRIEISAEGYIPFNSYETITADNKTYAESYLLVEGSDVEIGVASGVIEDAVTGNGVEEARLVIRRGWNAPVDLYDVVEETETSSNGEYYVNLPLGNYTVHVEKEGYVPNDFNIVVQGGFSSHQNASLSPVETGEKYRIVLTWGERPNDLDSHLEGYASDDGAMYHVYYGDLQAQDHEGTVVCNLDLDDTDSYGPETITLQCTSTKPYYYYVYNFSSTNELPVSNAQVKIYKGDELFRTFNVPNDQGDAVYWNVFSIKNGIITPKNTITQSPDISYN